MKFSNSFCDVLAKAYQASKNKEAGLFEEDCCDYHHGWWEPGCPECAKNLNDRLSEELLDLVKKEQGLAVMTEEELYELVEEKREELGCSEDQRDAVWLTLVEDQDRLTK